MSDQPLPICGAKPPSTPSAPGCGLRSGHADRGQTLHMAAADGRTWEEPPTVADFEALADTPQATAGRPLLEDVTTLESAVFQTIGAASMCWENPAGAGGFDSEQAGKIAEELLAWIRNRGDRDHAARADDRWIPVSGTIEALLDARRARIAQLELRVAELEDELKYVARERDQFGEVGEDAAVAVAPPCGDVQHPYPGVPCTRLAGHPGEHMHQAGGEQGVDWSRGPALDGSLACGEWCVVAGVRAECTKDSGHPGPHVAAERPEVVW